MYGFYRFHGLGTDFFYFFLPKIKHWVPKKSVPIREIRLIRTSVRITMYPKYNLSNAPQKEKGLSLRQPLKMLGLVCDGLITDTKKIYCINN
jgi:hypothetical protein